MLALVGDALADDAFHREALLVGIPAGDERLVLESQEPHLREPTQGASHDHIRRDSAFVAVVAPQVERGDAQALDHILRVAGHGTQGEQTDKPAQQSGENPGNKPFHPTEYIPFGICLPSPA